MRPGLRMTVMRRSAIAAGAEPGRTRDMVRSPRPCKTERPSQLSPVTGSIDRPLSGEAGDALHFGADPQDHRLVERPADDLHR